MRGELARPVDGDPPRAELALEGGDRLGGRDARVDARLDRVVLGGKPEGVIAHRVKHARGRVGGGNGRSRRRRSRPSGGRCAARRSGRAASRARMSSWPSRSSGATAAVLLAAGRRRWRPPTCARAPTRLPARLDLLRVVSALGHWQRRLASASRCRPTRWRARARGQRFQRAPDAASRGPGASPNASGRAGLDDRGGRRSRRAGVEAAAAGRTRYRAGSPGRPRRRRAARPARAPCRCRPTPPRR